MKKKEKSFFSQQHLKLFAIPVIIFTIYIFYRASVSDHKIFPLSFIFLLSGLIFESYRVLRNWKFVCWFIAGSYVFSLLVFLPGKHEHIYTFEDHLEIFPYFFLFFFTIGFAIFKSKETTQRFTEGITLLLSLATIYWVIDHNFWEVDNWVIKCLIIISLTFSAFSIFCSVIQLTLSKKIRLTLSIWSSIVLFLFAIENIYRIYQDQDIEFNEHFSQGLLIGLQFFILGVSAIYIVQNALMLIDFLPGRDSFFNEAYFKDLKELENRHIERYSNEQISPKDSVISIMVVGLIYGINFKFNFVPRQTIIWLTFILIPLLFRLVYLTKETEQLPPT